MSNQRRPIRIAFLEAYAGLYGSSQSLFSLVTNLPKHEVLPVVVMTRDGPQADRYRETSIDLQIFEPHPLLNEFGGKIVNYGLFTKGQIGFELIRCNLRFYKWLSAKKVDVVYVNDLRSFVYIFLAAKWLKKPIVWYVRADGRPSILSRLAVKMVDRIILIADGLNGLIPDHLRKKYAEKFVTLHTGFDFYQVDDRLSRRKHVRVKHNIPDDATVIGLVGSITRRKGHVELLKALSKLSADGWDCHVLFVGDSPVGDSSYKEEVVSVARQLRLSDRVHWAGYQADVLSYYVAFDVLALPPFSEGLPRVVVEALAVGVPVVATDVGGVRDIMTRSELGIVVPPVDVDALAEALVTVLSGHLVSSEDWRRVRMDDVRNRFGMTSYVNGFLAVVHDVIEKSLK